MFVSDETPPEIFDCPEDVVKTKDRNDDDFKVTWTRPMALDNSGENDLLQSENRPPGSVFDTGSTVVAYTFRDSSGNDAVCRFTVIVSDGSKSKYMRKLF